MRHSLRRVLEMMARQSQQKGGEEIVRDLIKLAVSLAAILAIVAGGRIEHFHHIGRGLLMVSFGIILLSVVTGATTMPQGPDLGN
ncbi:MAG: hypothetical protein OWR62_02025 [Sulfobacillus thermotolerans]|nr:hypothetical protein [Sulfobacillus thermotolerans]